jgi:hypothetical protein
MPDIAMCHGEINGLVCQSRKICYRATVTPSEFRQAYFAILPMDKDGACKHFTPNGLHDHPDCPCDHPQGTRGPCAGCNCADELP